LNQLHSRHNNFMYQLSVHCPYGTTVSKPPDHPTFSLQQCKVRLGLYSYRSKEKVGWSGGLETVVHMVFDLGNPKSS